MYHLCNFFNQLNLSFYIFYLWNWSTFVCINFCGPEQKLEKEYSYWGFNASIYIFFTNKSFGIRCELVHFPHWFPWFWPFLVPNDRNCTKTPLTADRPKATPPRTSTGTGTEPTCLTDSPQILLLKCFSDTELQRITCSMWKPAIQPGCTATSDVFRVKSTFSVDWFLESTFELAEELSSISGAVEDKNYSV